MRQVPVAVLDHQENGRGKDENQEDHGRIKVMLMIGGSVEPVGGIDRSMKQVREKDTPP